MNRLWVRFSLAFIAVLFLSVGTVVLVAIFAYVQRDTAFVQQAQTTPGTSGQHLTEPFILILVASGVGILGLIVGVGIVMSRSLTAPLNQLATAANRFAARDWNQRVPVRGAREIVQVATAFNQMADELQQQETLRRNLMADIAHELRTPLTVMQGNLHAMLDEMYPLNHAEIATLYDETRLLSHLVDDLRELALADAGKLPLHLAPLSVQTAIEQAASNFALPADAQNIRVQISPLPLLMPVRADSDRVAQVLRNLLANALQHTLEGGTITLGAEPQEKSVRVSVRDTGTGISQDDISQVFDRFYRGDKSRTRATGGTGLGLAIAKAWIDAMGGNIGVSSGVNSGSEFWFTLPNEKK